MAQKTAIIGSSLTGMALFSSLALYLYTSHALPELINPKIYKEETETRAKTVSDAVAAVKDKYYVSGNLLLPVRSISLNEKSQTTIPEYPVNLYLKEIRKTMTRKSHELVNISVENSKDKNLEFENFLADLTAGPLLQENKQEHATGNLKKIIVSQVGLSLKTAKILASIHRIDNLFGITGNVGHLFIMAEKSGNDQIDFSSLESFKKGTDLAAKEETKNGYSYIIINDIETKTDEVKTAIEPAIKADSDEINPYKWLYLATLLANDVEMKISKPLIILIYRTEPSHDVRPIIYPMDVELISREWIQTSDPTLHIGDARRILNHCRDFLPNEKIII